MKIRNTQEGSSDKQKLMFMYTYIRADALFRDTFAFKRTKRINSKVVKQQNRVPGYHKQGPWIKSYHLNNYRHFKILGDIPTR